MFEISFATYYLPYWLFSTFLKVGEKPLLLRLLPWDCDLDAAAATTGDHPDYSIQDRDQKEGGYETQNEDIHRGHARSVHGSYEASNLLQLAEASDQLVSGWFTVFPQCSAFIFIRLGCSL